MSSRTIVSFFFAFLVAFPATVGAETTSPTHGSAAAPADEYFGRLRLSIIGIKNELALIETRVEADPAHADAHLKTCDLIEESLEDWAVKYPHDSWLQDMLGRLELLYAHVASLDGKLHLARLVMWTHEHLRGSTADDATRVQAAKLFDVPLRTQDVLATPSPDPLDPTTPIVTPAPSPAATP